MLQSLIVTAAPSTTASADDAPFFHQFVQRVSGLVTPDSVSCILVPLGNSLPQSAVEMLATHEQQMNDRFTTKS